MSQVAIPGLPLNAGIVGTELLEISNSGVSEKVAISGLSPIFQLLSLKGAVSGYAGLDASQELLLANFPSGTGLQVLRRNAGNTALEFVTLSDLQGITSINGETGAAQTIAGTTNRIDVAISTDTQTLDIAATYVGQTSITTLGTITTGVWNGTAITGANINAASTDLTDTAVIARSTDNLSFFSATTSAQLAGVISDETGSGLLVFGTSPTIVTPTIVSFTNATHNHQDAAGGGTLLSTSALSDTANIAYLNTANTFGAFLQSFVSSSMRIPLSATPTMAVDGDFAIDTTVTDFSHGIVKYFDGEELGVVSMPIAQFTTPGDGEVVSYNATNDEFELVAGSVSTQIFSPAICVAFESTTRFSSTLINGGTTGIGISGVSLLTNASATASAKVFLPLLNNSRFNNVFRFYFSISNFTSGSDHETIVCVGDIDVDGSSITYTKKQVGFKTVRVSSGTIEISATNGNGSSETATDTGLTNFNGVYFIDKTASSIKFYAKTGTVAPFTLEATHTTNIPDIVNGNSFLGVSNTDVAVNTRIIVGSVSIEEEIVA